MAKYFKDGNRVHVAPDNATNILDELPPSVYSLRFNELSGFYLELTEDFSIPEHIYGDIEKKVKKIIKTYDHKGGNVGVLLSGEKGSGKTMMLRLICKNCADRGVPTIIISSNFEEDFCKFVTDINQKCVIVFDEFEKTFKKEESQNKLLTLFEGVYTSNKMLILTVNDIFHLNDYFLNRPGRLHYHIKFSALEQEFIEEYCEINLDKKTYTESILNLSKLVPNFNFDMLQAIVFECNLHEETPQEAFALLNIRHASTSDNYSFEIIDTLKDRKFTGTHILRPFTNDRFYFIEHCKETYKNEKGEDDDPYDSVKLTEENLVSAKDGKFDFKDGKYKITIKKEVRRSTFWEF